jgi:exonuclease SbcC
MPIKVRVRDFQSLGDVSLEIDGLTVVTGINNSGKSALMRAVRAAFLNAKGNSFIRHGTTKAIVDLDFGDGHTLTWEKGRGKADKPTYVIDGGKPIHPGQGVPDEVKAFGVHPISAGGKEVWPQIARQFDGQVFLLDQPGSVMAEAVADLDRVSTLNEALRKAAQDQRSCAADLASRLSDLATLQGELKQFEGLDETIGTVGEIEQAAVLLRRIEAALTQLGQLQVRLRAASTVVDTLSAIRKVGVPESSAITEAQEAVEKIASLQALRARLSSSASRVESLSGASTEATPDTSEVLRAQESLQSLTPLASRIRKSSNAIRSLNALDCDIVPDHSGAERLQSAFQVVLGLRDKCRMAGQAVAGVSNELDTAQHELAQTNEELVASLNGLVSCPVCNSTLSGSH